MTQLKMIDNHEVNKWELALTGSIEMSEDDADQTSLDKVTVFVVAAHAGKAAFEVLSDGDVRRRNTMKLSDAAVLTGKLREQAIVFLSSGADQGYMDFPMPVHPAEPTQDGEIQEINGQRQIFFQGEWRDIEDTDVNPEEFDEALAAQPGESGPKVAKFSDNKYAEVQETEVVGTLRNGNRKDKVLAEFLDSNA